MGLNSLYYIFINLYAKDYIVLYMYSYVYLHYIIILGCDAFESNPIMEDGSYSYPSNVTVSCVKN